MKHNPGFLKLVNEARARVKECTVAQAKSRLDRGEVLHFLDVREDHEFAKDHAKGARHLGKGVIERDAETCIPNKDEAVCLLPLSTTRANPVFSATVFVAEEILFM